MTTAVLHVPTRPRDGRAAAPVRIVHLGLGAFHRAHQAWYTAHCADADMWGIASFTGRAGEPSDSIVAALRAQDHLYTLTLRGPDEDALEVIDSIVAVHSAAEIDAWVGYIVRPEVAIISTTVTEAGYRLDADWNPRADDAVVASDLAALASGTGSLESPLALIAHALEQRRLVGGGPLTVMPCDNMPDNGALVRAGLLAFASAVGLELQEWIEENVSFVSTSVDRITPRFSDDDLDLPHAHGLDDAVPVVTEPFINWILQGDFAAGRPAWETAGAEFVADLEPFENRKLWLLNGAHTAMAGFSRLRGCATVADASADPASRELVEAFWSEARRHLPVGVRAEEYCTALWERFENPRIAHSLAQIAEDSATKLGVRAAPVALAELDAGRTAEGCARVIAAWAAAMIAGQGQRDSRQADIDAAVASNDATRALVAVVSPTLAARAGFVELVDGALAC
ncbi:mannitol dehydrogenase family protein [Demequina soli]|uniref:mannitol dehydrogenase family protein n=1 Tax=Demequina soli TaxID=1638987 RepID=UPI0007813B26|nr:mannitol dehydrogenase family protein [Demequina soli]